MARGAHRVGAPGGGGGGGGGAGAGSASTGTGGLVSGGSRTGISFEEASVLMRSVR